MFFPSHKASFYGSLNFEGPSFWLLRPANVWNNKHEWKIVFFMSISIYLVGIVIGRTIFNGKMLTIEWNSVSTETINTHNDYYYCDIMCNEIISEVFQKYCENIFSLRFLVRMGEFEEHRICGISNVAKLPPWWMVAPFTTKHEHWNGNGNKKMSIILNPSAINNIQRKSHSKTHYSVSLWRERSWKGRPSIAWYCKHLQITLSPTMSPTLCSNRYANAKGKWS